MRHKEQLEQIAEWYRDIVTRVTELDNAIFKQNSVKPQIKAASESSVHAVLEEVRGLRREVTTISDEMRRFRDELRTLQPADLESIRKIAGELNTNAIRANGELIDVKTQFSRLWDKVMELGQLARRN